MTALRLGAFLHLLGAVLVTGYTLFWVVMAVTLGREDSGDSKRLLGVVGASRWPPAGPYRFRLPLSLVGFGILGSLAMTGLFMASLYGTGFMELVSGEGAWGGPMAVKLACFGVLLAGQIGIMLRPSAAFAYLNGAATVAILLFSALLRH